MKQEGKLMKAIKGLEDIEDYLDLVDWMELDPETQRLLNELGEPEHELL